jgi:PST family polysaccharide transporter
MKSAPRQVNRSSKSSSVGTAALGQYRYAYQSGWMPALKIIQRFSCVLFPAFSGKASDRSRFRDAFVCALQLISFAARPVGALMVVVGQRGVVLSPSEEWGPAGFASVAMAGFGLGIARSFVSRLEIKGARCSILLNWTIILRLALGVELVLLHVPFGLAAVGTGIILTYLVCGCVGVELARSVASLSSSDVISSPAPATLSASLGVAVVLLLDRNFVDSGQGNELLGIASGVGEYLLLTHAHLCVRRQVSPDRYRSVREAAHLALVRPTDSTRHPRDPRAVWIRTAANPSQDSNRYLWRGNESRV